MLAGVGADIFGRLLDRELELEAIGRAVDRAAAGSSGLVVVEGPPGIGKTALMECARERAHSLDMTLLSARGYELERGFAFGAARQMFEAVLRGAHERERATLLDGAASLAKLVPRPRRRCRSAQTPHSRCSTACTGSHPISQIEPPSCSQSMICTGSTPRRSTLPPCPECRRGLVVHALTACRFGGFLCG